MEEIWLLNSQNKINTISKKDSSPEDSIGQNTVMFDQESGKFKFEDKNKRRVKQKAKRDEL